MSDYLVRILAKEAGVRGLACMTTELARDGIRRHEAEAAVAESLARALTGGALLGALLKVKQRVAAKFEGDGPVRKIIVESDAYGRVRGYVRQPEESSSAGFTVAEALGRGQLVVVKDVLLKDLVESTVPLSSGEIDDDISFYLNQSEQIPSLVEIGTQLDADGALAFAGGLLIQAMPGHDGDDAVAMLAERLEEMPPLDALLAQGKTPEQILDDLFHDIEYITLEHRPLRFECRCSWERSARALVVLGRAEVEAILENEGQTVVTCHFCHDKYEFSRGDLEEILDKLV